MADPLALSGYRKVYVPTSKSSVVSVYTAAEVDRLLLNYMPAYVAQEIEGIDVESYFVENVIIANTMVTNVLYAEYGRIARLSVSELNTAWKKITNYLLKDTDLAASTADVNYIRAYEQYIRWIAAETDGLATQHETDYDGNPLYWTDDTHTGMTTTANAFPVTTWVYTERIKREISFMETDTYEIPVDVFGAGVGSEAYPERGKGFIYKDGQGLLFKYIKADGTEVWLRLGESGAEGSFGLYSEVTAIEFNVEGMDVTYADEQVHNWDFVTNTAGRIVRLDNLSTHRSIDISYLGV